MTVLTPAPRPATAGAPTTRMAPDLPAAIPATDREDDARLVDRARSGDTAAFDALVVKYSPRLYGLIYHMTSNRDDANDLLQDALGRAWRSLGKFRGQSAFYTWLYAIATNLTLNYLKKRSRRQHMSLDDIDCGIANDEEFIALTSTSDPHRETRLRELQRRLNEAMQQLSPDHRAVVTMFDIQGLPHSEISRVLGVNEGTVRSRLHYAHRMLQSLLADQMGD